jgi:group I intron endonuclease
MYIYKFTHIPTDRCYIGQTIQNPNQRRLEHIADSRYTTREYHFHNALRKYGIDSFTFEVLATASTLEELNLLEEKYMEQFDSINNGFNIRQAGGNKLHSAESKERMSIAQKEAHAKRRAEGRDTHKKHKKHIFTNPRANKGSTNSNKGKKLGMTWDEIYGIEGAAIRREKIKLRKLQKEASV